VDDAVVTRRAWSRSSRPRLIEDLPQAPPQLEGSFTPLAADFPMHGG
jgi:hypothetical protein